MKETTTEAVTVTKKRRFSFENFGRNVTILILAATSGIIYYKFVKTLFENDTHFSHLSDLEREMSMETERGFYYSYYKTIVEENTLMMGLHKLMYDRLVEFPKVVNAFNRFNIHPEVIIGVLYKYFEPTLNTSTYRQCHTVSRGEDLAPVESCVGLGVPMLFYLEAIWILAAVTMAAVFLHAVVLSESILGGLLTVAQYYANHIHATRVQWAPNERENMAMPLLALQMFLLTLQLRDRGNRNVFQLQMLIFILNCLCLLFWQFSQFIFLTQIAIFFIMEQFRIIELKSLCILLHAHFCGLHMAVLLLQGNAMLKSSLFTSFFLVLSGYCILSSSIRVKVKHRFDLYVEAWLVLLRVSIVICTSIYLKKIISGILDSQDDSHIWDLLRAKFTDYKDFYTLMYTCSQSFGFLPWSTVTEISSTLLLPLVIIVGINSVLRWIHNSLSLVKRSREKFAKKKTKDKASDTEDSGIENLENLNKDLDKLEGKFKNKECDDGVVLFLKNLTIEPAIFYNFSQLVVYGVLAVLFMRLKLLFVTQLCVVCSLIVNKNNYLRPRSRLIPLFLVWSVCFVAIAGFFNVSRQLNYIGEYADPQQEELLSWIVSSTAPSSSFAGSLPLMATVMLVARRPVVAHPHFEHLHARQRAYTVNMVYGRFTAEEVYQELSKLRVTYLIVERNFCFGKSDSGACTCLGAWDAAAGPAPPRPQLCRALLAGGPAPHLYRVFRNHRYRVFQLHDLSLRYMPRYFDT